MTTATPETPATEAKATEPTRVVPLIETLPDLLKLIMEQLTKQHETAKNAVAKINAADGSNIGELLSVLRSESADPYVVERRERVEKANALINKLISEMDTHLAPKLEVPSEEDVEKAKAELKELTSAFKAGATMFDTTAKTFGLDVTTADYVENLPGMRAKRTTGTAGNVGEIRRPRVKAVEVAKGINPADTEYTKLGDENKSTFSHLTQYFKSEGKTVATKDLQDAWFKQNGTEDTDAIPAVSTFSYSADGEHYSVRITK